MPTSERTRPSSAQDELGTTLLQVAVFGVAGLGLALWAGGVLASLGNS